MRRNSLSPARRAPAFTLVELLVVIGIIALIIGLLMPALAGARQQAKWVNCQSNLRQIGYALEMYSHNWKGWIYPPMLGANRVPEERWPVHVFKPAVYDPPVMTCPADFEPRERHSYLLNDHLHLHGIKLNSRNLGGLTSSEVIVMGEKRTDWEDYYMNKGDYGTRVEPYRHGLQRGSNYLFMDWHVGTLKNRRNVLQGIDPWDPPVAERQ